MILNFKLYTAALACVFATALVISISWLQGCDTGNPSAEPIAVDDVFEIINDSVRVNQFVVLDTRARMDYVRGHLVSAIWMNVDSIPKYIPMLTTEKRPMIIYDSEGVESLRAAIFLLRNGITNFYIMEGGFSEWLKRGFPAAIQLVINTSDYIDVKRKDISAEQLFLIAGNYDNKTTIIDLRSRQVYREGHIEHAVSIPYVPLNEFVVQVEEQNFPRDRPLIVYCDANTRDIGEKACEVLLRNLYTNVHLLNGGLEEWYSHQYPLAYD
jgi:rhodanese-related sulfurtransferase